MKKIQKGFTLIELLIVIAIIGILAGVILVSTSSARTKANIAAFKSEAKGSIPGLMMACDSRVLVAATEYPLTSVNASGVVTLGIGADGHCGPTGDGQFEVTLTPKKADVLDAVTGCGIATVKPTGVTYTGPCL